jgi:hypothetical protein
MLSDEHSAAEQFAWSIRPLRVGSRGVGLGVAGGF